MNASQLASSIASKQARIGVIGLGYVGMPLAMLFARKGFRVSGFIRDKKKIAAINSSAWQGDSVDDKDLAKLVKNKAIRAFPIDSPSLEEQDAIFICVPTPVFHNKKPDLAAIREVASRLRMFSLSGKLIINESTVAPGTTREEFGQFRGAYFLSCSPERVDPGNKEKTVATVPKVIGGRDKKSTMLTKALYDMVLTAPPVIVSSLEAAETVKMLENTYRAVNIALVNEFAILAEKNGLDIVEIINAAKTKWSFHAHYPSIGVGGHCIPVDPWYLVDYGRKKSIGLPLIKLGLTENEHMTKHVAEKLLSLSKKGMSVLVYGITYKKDVKDIRESPVLQFLALIRNAGVIPNVYDPLFTSKEIEGLNLVPGPLVKADIFVVGTDHTELKRDYKKAIGPDTIVLDGRNFFSAKVGRIVYGIGRTLV